MDEFPEPQPGPSWPRLRLRLACSGGVALLQLLVFRELVIQSLPFLWPPREPLSQWVSFIMISAGSVIVISGLIGTLIADQLYNRLQESSTSQ